jgi:hypothetical protein
MRWSCTPGEWKVALAQLELLPAERREAIASMLFEAASECLCGESVRRVDARRFVARRLSHLRCVEVAGRNR